MHRFRFPATVAFAMGAFAIGVTLTACSPQSPSLYPTLADQGILPLSSSNPYVGANLYLAKEAEQSAVLFQFLDHRGGPSALEVIEEGLPRPRILLYYAEAKEVFAADLDRREGYYEWIVRGPFPIERQDYRSLMSSTVSGLARPKFILWNHPYEFRGMRNTMRASAGDTEILSPAVPAPAPTPVPKRVQRKPASKTSTAVEAAPPKETPLTVESFQKLNSDQQALLMAQGYAERSASGDLVHTIEKPGETLDGIAAWYGAGSITAAELAAFNNLPPTTPLVPGMRITIPRNRAKQLKRPSSASPATPNLSVPAALSTAAPSAVPAAGGEKSPHKTEQAHH